MIILVLILVGLVTILARSLLKNDQLFISISTALIALFGVVLTISTQSWLTLYKSKIERQQDGVNRMSSYYEEIVKVLNEPGDYALKDVLKFIKKFDCKVMNYGSNNIVYQWKRLKERIPITQINPSKAESRDLHAFRNFIWAIRKEMGYTNSPEIRYYILKELKTKYKKKETYQTSQSPNLGIFNTNSTSKNSEKKFSSSVG